MERAQVELQRNWNNGVELDPIHLCPGLSLVPCTCVRLLAVKSSTNDEHQDPGHEKGPLGVHEDVPRAEMGDVQQMLPGLGKIQAEPPADGADAPAAVRGRLEQRLRLQRQVQPQGQRNDRVLKPPSVLLRERRHPGPGH